MLCHSATECDFDGGSCGWYELTLGDGFDWVWGTSAELPPHLYGDPPPLDHTTNSTDGKRTHFSLQKFLFCLFFFQNHHLLFSKRLLLESVQSVFLECYTSWWEHVCDDLENLMMGPQLERRDHSSSSPHRLTQSESGIYRRASQIIPVHAQPESSCDFLFYLMGFMKRGLLFYSPEFGM